MTERVDYTILSYAQSELVATGEDICVILAFQGRRGPCLRACRRSDWKSVIADADDSTIEYLEMLFYDIRQHLVRDCSEATDIFLEAMSAMDVGPIRTSSFGSYSFDGCEPSISSLLNAPGQIEAAPPDAFEILRASIMAQYNQVHAART